jgi:N-acetylglucosaminyldiphosphoundecaprenol N-acetyl-beta-D-mannosaminyltransferase
MRDDGKRNLLGVAVSVCDYEGATARIIAAAEEGRPFSVSCAAVHGIMTAALDPVHRHRMNHFAMVTPDGQPVRWALDLLHKAALPDRVYGPNLTLHVAEAAAAAGLPIYLYGSEARVVATLAEQLEKRFPGLQVAGWEPSRFAEAGPDECDAIAARIRATGARICLVGLGCPRQEVWASALSERLSMPTLCVGVAFEFHAGLKRDAPALLQRWGLQWLWRLVQEPRRLWRRYLLLNPAYVALLALQRLGLWKPDTVGRAPDPTEPVPA